MGTGKALEKQVLRVKHEVIGPTPRTRKQFNPASFLEKMFGDSCVDNISSWTRTKLVKVKINNAKVKEQITQV